MSKISIEGNASGTGTITIAAPNTNSNATLTLPTASGTVVTTAGAQTIEFAAGTAGAPSITFTGDTNTGIFSPAADTIAFSEGGAEAMRIDSSGNVGIGTTSNLLSAANRVTVSVNGTSSSALAFGVGDTRRAHIYVDGSEMAIAAGQSGQSQVMTFQTNGAERARITSGGDLLVGTTSDPNIFSVVGGPATSTYHSNLTNTKSSDAFGLRIFYNNSSPNNAGNQFFDCIDSAGGATLRVRFYSNGGLANYSANDANLSDRREKTNFAPAKNYLDTICAIPVQTFNYIDQNLEEDDGLTLGVVAQDVQEVAPELVMESNWGSEEEPKMRLSIYQTDLQYALMKSIQELKAITDTQAQTISALEARIAALETGE